MRIDVSVPKKKDQFCVCAVCANLARRFVVRDMGNEVDRIEAFDLIPIEAAKEEAKLPERTPLSLPHSDRIEDIFATGCSKVYCGNCIPFGFVRPIDDSSFEMMIWRRA